MFTQSQSMMDWQPSCAICGCRPTPEFPDECHHEADALTQALQQALDRSEIVQRIKDWVIDNAKRQIGRNFGELKAARFQYHTQYVQQLPCYSLYQRYRGNPPFHTPQLQNLKIQITNAQQAFVQGVDEDWRKSCLEYPNVLNYFFNLVEVDFPGDEEDSVREPVLGRASPALASGGAGGRRGTAKARRGSGDYGNGGHNGHRRRERRRSRARTRTPPRAPSVGRY